MPSEIWVDRWLAPIGFDLLHKIAITIVRERCGLPGGIDRDGGELILDVEALGVGLSIFHAGVSNLPYGSVNMSLVIVCLLCLYLIPLEYESSCIVF